MPVIEWISENVLGRSRPTRSDRGFEDATALLRQVTPPGDIGYAYVAEYNVAAAVETLEEARSSGHTGAMRTLIELIEADRIRAYARTKLPPLFRDLFNLGDLSAGHKFATHLDRGQHCPRNTNRATDTYASIRRAYLELACLGDRGAMIQLGYYYANGIGLSSNDANHACEDMERHWRIAL